MRKIKENKKKIFLKLLFRLRNMEEFFNIENKFKNKGYIIEEFGEIEKRNFNFNNLKNKIIELKNKHGDKAEIVVASNIKDVLFASYVINNEIIDQHIFFMDKINYNILNECDEKIIEVSKLSKNITENIKGKIYSNINFDNFLNYFEFLCTEDRFIFFERIENLSFEKEEKLKVIREESKAINLQNSSYFFVFYIVGLIKTIGIKETREKFKNIIEEIQKSNPNKREKIASEIYSIDKIESLDFKEKMAIYSFVVSLNLVDNRIIRKIMDSLKKDNLGNEKYYAPIISDILYYMNKNGDLVYRGFNEDLKEIITKIQDYYLLKNDIEYKYSYEKGNKKIAFIVDGLVNANYSLERVTFDTVKNLKKYYPEYEVTIFVENNYSYTPEEKIMIYSFIGELPVGSEYFSEEHNKEIEGTDARILYSLPITNKEYRVKDMIHAIFEYNPEIVITSTLCSYSINTLYQYYPTLYLSLISLNDINDFDIELYDMEYIRKKFRREVIQENMHNFYLGIDYKKSVLEYQRELFNLKKDDFVMVSVGVRLKAEMNREYIDFICNFIKKNQKIKWYLIGEVSFPEIEKNYSELLGTQIFVKEFEENLGAFYRMCDIYINPPREGGGFSIAQAIINDIPVVNLRESASGNGFIGDKNSVLSLREYIEEVKKLMTDREYYLTKLNLEKESIKRFDYKEVIKKLVYYMEMAEESYLKRKSR